MEGNGYRLRIWALVMVITSILTGCSWEAVELPLCVACGRLLVSGALGCHPYVCRPSVHGAIADCGRRFDLY